MAKGRPRLNRPRYPSGKLMPPPPNARVVENRRALLGEGERLDLRLAESPLDLAKARGWLTGRRRTAAARYAAMWAVHTGRVLGYVPGIKVPNMEALAPTTEIAPLSAGRMTPADLDLAQAVQDYDLGRITEKTLRTAEKRHLKARVDWQRLPDKHVTAIFDAALEKMHGRFGVEEQAPEAERLRKGGIIREQLQRIWARLTPAQSRALFAACVQAAWPQWVSLLVEGVSLSPSDKRERADLEFALDVVIHETQPPSTKPTTIEPVPAPVYRRSVEVTVYESEAGEVLYVGEKWSPRFADEPAEGADQQS